MNEHTDAESGSSELQPILEGDAEPSTSHDSTWATWLRHLLHNSLVRTAGKNLSLICLWYFFSTLLSLWNRTLLGKGHGVLGKGAFPAPMLMSSLQFGSQIFMASTVLKMGIVKRKKPADLSWQQYFIQVVPNGTATGLDIGLSNFSLSLITLSFYTMCKSTTPVFLLAFCFLWGIERPSWSLALVVLVISLGLGLLVAGETEFNLAGFVIVMVASALSGLRWTITQVLLQGSEAHGTGSSGGPVEVLLALMPVMAVTVAFMSLVAERLWLVLPGSPYFDSLESLAVTLVLMLFGGTLAFFMVWTEFTVISETSALTFMVAGTFKEIVTVVAAVIFLGESFSVTNGVGLFVLICGVVLFNVNKYRKMLSGQAKGAVRYDPEKAAAVMTANGGGADMHHANGGIYEDTARLVGGVAGASPRSVKGSGVSPALSIEMASHRGSLHTHGSGTSTPVSPALK